MQILIMKTCGFSLNAVAPAAYVHLVALRFHKLLDTEAGSDTNSPKRSHSGSSIAEGKAMQTIPAHKLQPHESMFFC
jgi:hypothetical protein